MDNWKQANIIYQFFTTLRKDCIIHCEKVDSDIVENAPECLYNVFIVENAQECRMCQSFLSEYVFFYSLFLFSIVVFGLVVMDF